MEVFAGFAAHTDAELGRAVDAVRSLADRETTSIIYILGDTGASAEGGTGGTLNELAPANGLEEKVAAAHLADLGGPAYNNNYPAGWSMSRGGRPIGMLLQSVRERTGVFSPPPSCAASGKGKSRRIHGEYPH